MKEYSKMSRAELLSRVQELEALNRTGALNARGPKSKSRTAERDESAQRLRAILETAVEGIVTIDQRGIVESMNPAAERIFGYEPEEVIGQNVALLMPAPYREAHDGYVATYLRTGQAKIIGIGREVVGQRKDGSVFPMDLAVSEVHLSDRRLFTGFIRDITERKRLEREILEISDRERRRIGQDLHDGLCQHLAGIELMSQVLEQKLAPRSKTDAARAGEIARHVREAISQTRSLARGLSPVTLESEGLATGLQELAANAEKMFGASCRVECPTPVLVPALSAATHLYRIAQEAVSNALKHGKATNVTIRLEPEGSRIRLSIFDNGSGFSPDDSHKNGMGLHIMQYRAGMLGGTLSVERNPVGGTRVVCLVPQNPAPSASKPEMKRTTTDEHR